MDDDGCLFSGTVEQQRSRQWKHMACPLLKQSTEASGLCEKTGSKSICVGLDKTWTVWTVDVRRRRGAVFTVTTVGGSEGANGAYIVDFASLSAPVASVTSRRLPRRLRLPRGAFVNASVKKLILVPAECCKCFPACTHACVPSLLFWGKQVFPFHLSSKTGRAGALTEKRRSESGAERSGTAQQQQAEGTEDDSAFE